MTLLIRCLWQQKGGAVDISVRHGVCLLKTMPKYFHPSLFHIVAKQKNGAPTTNGLPGNKHFVSGGRGGVVCWTGERRQTQREGPIWPIGRLLPTATNDATAFSPAPSPRSDHRYAFAPNLPSTARDRQTGQTKPGRHVRRR